MINRRETLAGLVATAVIPVGSLIPAKPVIMNWDGAILHEPSEQLIAYVREIMRDYVKTAYFIE